MMQWGRYVEASFLSCTGKICTYNHHIPRQQDHHNVGRKWKISSSKRTGNLNVRYNFITDQIKMGHLKVAFCPTHEILADFFRKPLQGTLFICMHKKILNLPARTKFTGLCWKHAKKCMTGMTKIKI